MRLIKHSTLQHIALLSLITEAGAETKHVAHLSSHWYQKKVTVSISFLLMVYIRRQKHWDES